VRVTIFDVKGRLVRTLTGGAEKAQSGLVVWDGRDGRGWRLPTGTYWARLESGAESRRVRLMLIR
jgi:flagellar hook assembly protein FlgD